MVFGPFKKCCKLEIIVWLNKNIEKTLTIFDPQEVSVYKFLNSVQTKKRYN